LENGGDLKSGKISFEQKIQNVQKSMFLVLFKKRVFSLFAHF
jgi:hypothetical protein